MTMTIMMTSATMTSGGMTMTDAELIVLLRSKQICTGFKPDGHGDVGVVYGPDPVTAEAADRIEALTDALDNLLEAITAEDQFHDRSLTITGSTANLRWLLEAEDDARAALKGENHE